MSILGERIILELNGVSCFSLDSAPTPKKGIASTRSFGKSVKTLDEIKEAITMHIVNASRKLRKQKSVCSFLTLYIRSSKHDKYNNYYSNAISVALPYPTDNTLIMIKYALKVVHKLFENGTLYKKVGVYLTDITQKSNIQSNLFEVLDPGAEARGDELMKSIDKLNGKFGKELIRFAVEGFKREWKVKAENVSPKYTTSWNDLKVIKI